MYQFFFVLLSLVFVPAFDPAHAYLDPGSGSYMLQLAIGLMLGVIVTSRMYWTKIKIFFKKYIEMVQKKDSKTKK